MRHFHYLHGGLDGVARQLGLVRVARRQHQASSDSLLTCRVFYKMRNNYFVKGVSNVDVLHGLTNQLD